MSTWLREIPENALVLDDEEHTALILRREWERIDAYDTSTPTGPSPGRVYRRRGAMRHVPGRPDEPDVLFICRPCVPGDGHEVSDGYVDHHGYEAIVVD